MKLANMQGLGPCALRGLWVQIPPSAQSHTKLNIFQHYIKTPSREGVLGFVLVMKFLWS